MTTYTGLFLDAGCGWLVRRRRNATRGQKIPDPLASLDVKGDVMSRLTMLVPKPGGFKPLVRVYSRFAYVRELASRGALFEFGIAERLAQLKRALIATFWSLRSSSTIRFRPISVLPADFVCALPIIYSQ